MGDTKTCKMLQKIHCALTPSYGAELSLTHSFFEVYVLAIRNPLISSIGGYFLCFQGNVKLFVASFDLLYLDC